LKPNGEALSSANYEGREKALDRVFKLDAVRGEFVVFKVVLEIGRNEPAPVNHTRILIERAPLVPFTDFRSLVEGCGFVLDRIEASHHIFIHAQVAEPVNLQSVKGEAKPHQIRQVLRLVERYDLRLEHEGD